MGTAVLASALEQLRAMVHAKACEELSDRQLLEQFLIQREEAAFVALLQRHGPMVLQVCRRVQGNDHDAEDVLQATFLLLARKAGSIRKPESLASWLHGVAQRLAMKARSQESRRQAIERRAADMRSTGQVSDATWRELQRTLDEALRHVPEKYRLPLVICYLEGKTQEEAARQLRCPLGTVRSRLARGRERLKTVLERRGVCLSAAALTAGLAASAPSATVPPLLIQTTARAAIAFGAGKAAATLVSARAAALVEGGLKIMLTTKIKIVTTVLLTIGTLGLGAGAIATRLMAGSPQATQPTQLGKHQPSSQRPASEPSQESVRLRGRVLDIDGKPMAKANLLLYGTPGKPVDLGSPAADGQFMIEVPEKLKGYFLVARADNAGLDFVNLEKWDRTAPVELRLVADRLIRGRIMGTEGKPAAGVHVQIRNITVYANHALEPFLAERKKRNFNFGLPDGAKYVYFNADSYLETTTDANGQFTFTGVGADRLVGVRVNGASIADEALTILNCDGVEQTKPYTVGTGIMPPKPIGPIRSEPLLYGPDLSVVVEADKPIQGVVTAADTGKPLAGVEVVLPRNADSILGLFLSAKTDAQGRYEIRGARKCKEYEVRVKGDSAAGYLDSSGVATDTPGYQPVTADISVTK
ncbi:MAG TPA: sigma-70 family RNA polymerase sigma factor, partial [Gemmataceae bacterium]|nr:sigma-70 family RNA polymerase sigma factor [Gemmataceae bacterium]